MNLLVKRCYRDLLGFGAGFREVTLQDPKKSPPKETSVMGPFHLHKRTYLLFTGKQLVSTSSDSLYVWWMGKFIR